MAGCRSTLSMSKIEVKISETKYHSFYKTLIFWKWEKIPLPFVLFKTLSLLLASNWLSKISVCDLVWQKWFRKIVRIWPAKFLSFYKSLHTLEVIFCIPNIYICPKIKGRVKKRWIFYFLLGGESKRVIFHFIFFCSKWPKNQFYTLKLFSCIPQASSSLPLVS